MSYLRAVRRAEFSKIPDRFFDKMTDITGDAEERTLMSRNTIVVVVVVLIIVLGGYSFL